MRSTLWHRLLLVVLSASTTSLASQANNTSGSDAGSSGHTHNSSSTPGTSSSGSSMTGDAFCSTTMCVGALVNGSVVQYTLQSRGAATLGWMAMGFGTSMADSSMVLMWSNSDDSITLSQRSAPGEIMPTVQSNPPFNATLQSSMSSINGSTPKFAYSTPLNSTATQNIIWAFGSDNPDDSAVDASVVQHLDFGTASLNLGGTLNSTSRNPSNPVSVGFTSGAPNGNSTTPGDGGSKVSTLPLLSYQKMLIAHGILTAIGFLVVLPFGALIARYSRTFTSRWFTAHWVFQFALALPIIVAGVALGIAAVSKAGAPHLNDTHKKWGVAIFVLYFAQLLLGALVHWVKPKFAKPGLRRPLHNYLHAIFGLFIIAVSFYQVRTGFRVEWPLTTGRGNVSNAANIIWYIWVVLMPVLYFAGLLLLRRQFRQEVAMHHERLTSSSDDGRQSTSDETRLRT